jgi:tetratricopeptide (TPR) repeat protein
MDDEDPGCHLALAVAYSWSWDLDRAKEHALRALALWPNSVELMILLAVVQIYAGDPADGLTTLDAMMRLDPHCPDIALQFPADARFSVGEYEQAIGAIERRLKRNPESERAYALVASCFWLGRTEDAHVTWVEALRINADFSIDRRRQV